LLLLCKLYMHMFHFWFELYILVTALHFRIAASYTYSRNNNIIIIITVLLLNRPDRFVRFLDDKVATIS